MALLIPCVSAPFRVLQKIGAGGMGEVFLAVDERLGRRIALKRLRPNADFAPALLLHEARAAALLNHPNIATVHDVAETDGRLHIVMEHLVGETLASRLRRGANPTAEAVRIATEVARGLAHSHSHRLLHCDLKPGNIFLLEGGAVKILDFGLAKAVAPDAAESMQPTMPSPARFTDPGGTVGDRRAHVAGAAAGRTARCAHRSVFIRARAVRDGDGTAGVRGVDERGRFGGDSPRDAACATPRSTGSAIGAGAGAAQGTRERSRRSLSDRVGAARGSQTREARSRFALEAQRRGVLDHRVHASARGASHPTSAGIVRRATGCRAGAAAPGLRWQRW